MRTSCWQQRQSESILSGKLTYSGYIWAWVRAIGEIWNKEAFAKMLANVNFRGIFVLNFKLYEFFEYLREAIGGHKPPDITLPVSGKAGRNPRT